MLPQAGALLCILTGCSLATAAAAACQVLGKTAGDRYTVFPHHFCSCQAFFYEVVTRADSLQVRQGHKQGKVQGRWLKRELRGQETRQEHAA